MDVKVGDVVHVDAQVVKIANGFEASVRLNVNGSLIWVMPACIKHVEPRPLQVGDRVRYTGLRYDVDVGEIKAIVRGFAAVDFDNGSFLIVDLTSLQHLERA